MERRYLILDLIKNFWIIVFLREFNFNFSRCWTFLGQYQSANGYGAMRWRKSLHATAFLRDALMPLPVFIRLRFRFRIKQLSTASNISVQFCIGDRCNYFFCEITPLNNSNGTILNIPSIGEFYQVDGNRGRDKILIYVWWSYGWSFRSGS